MSSTNLTGNAIELICMNIQQKVSAKDRKTDKWLEDERSGKATVLHKVQGKLPPEQVFSETSSEKYIMGDYNLQCSMRSFKLKDGVYAYDWQVAHSCQFENRKLSYVPRRIVLTSKDISPLQEKIYKYTEEERQKFLMFIWGEMDKIPSDVLYSTESLSASDIEKTLNIYKNHLECMTLM